MSSPQGNLPWRPLAQHPELVAPSVAAAAAQVPTARVARVNPVMVGASFCQAYDVLPDALVRCTALEVEGGAADHAAVVVRKTDRADLDLAREHLGAQEVRAMGSAQVHRLTGSDAAALAPVGLPLGWPVLVDERVAQAPWVVARAGVSESRLLVSGDDLARLPGVQVVDLVGAGED